MKPLPTRELLLVAAPLVIVGAGIWGARLREQHWPTHPRINACRVRPAMPLEVYNGKQIAVTVEGVVPEPVRKGQYPWIRYWLTGRPQPKVIGLTGNFSSAQRSGYEYLEQQHAYTWKEFSALPRPRTAEVALFAGDRPTLLAKGHFELSADGIASPDAATARTANFRIAKVQLLGTGVSSGTNLNFEAEDVRDETQGTLQSSQCQGLELRQNHRTYPTRWLSTSTGSLTPDPTSVQFQVEVNLTSLEVPPAANAKFRCLLSLAGGWPQEVEVELPKRLDRYTPDLKFTTKLAPIPNK